MQTRTVERVETWDAARFDGGADALASLADAGFSGAVVVDDAWLFLVNGRAVGVYGGTVADVVAGSGTHYRAPDVSLALLFAMQEAGGETQAQYYTNETPLAETDTTLTEAGFTGYVELSENVLSGDYYTAYYGGRSLSAAFVGNAPEVLTGEEAFERAADEVGVYDVVSVDLAFPDLPEPEASAADEPTRTTAADEATTNDEPTTGEGALDEPAAATDKQAAAGEPASEIAAAASSDRGTTDGTTTASPPEERVSDSSDGDASTASETDVIPTENVEAPAGPASAADSANAETASENTETARRDGTVETTRRSERESGRHASRDHPEASEPVSADGVRASGATAGDDVFSEEAEWRETTTIPSIDPEASAVGASGNAESADAPSGDAAGTERPESTGSTTRRSIGRNAERAASLREAIAEREDRIAELEAELEGSRDEVREVEEELASLRAERDELREERDELRERVEELEAQVREIEAEREAERALATDEPVDSKSLTPTAALAGTNLFVRYDSKAEPTLDDIGEADQTAIDANLSLEHHTTFDAEDVTVDGEPYEAFLRETPAFRFVSWAVRELPFEILDTGHQKNLADLYDALPDVDRAELDGTVSVDEGESEESRTFDVVLRDRMGEPLAVAELNASRDPVTGEEMEALTAAAETVRQGADGLGAALYVTSSFFEPDALEAAADATASGGLLDRSDKESYVRMDRKTGFHLCLAEDRDGSFHVTMPDL